MKRIKKYAARRSDRPSSVADYCGGRVAEDGKAIRLRRINTADLSASVVADDTLMVDQGSKVPKFKP